MDEYKWYLEKNPPTNVGGGNLYASRSIKIFQFFTDQEKEVHLEKLAMKAVESDEYAQRRLAETFEAMLNPATQEG